MASTEDNEPLQEKLGAFAVGMCLSCSGVGACVVAGIRPTLASGGGFGTCAVGAGAGVFGVGVNIGV
jgi:hypothetical protein